MKIMRLYIDSSVIM